jgi:hypothetical protein
MIIEQWAELSTLKSKKIFVLIVPLSNIALRCSPSKKEEIVVEKNSRLHTMEGKISFFSVKSSKYH